MTQEQALTFASYTAAITVSRMGAMPSLPLLEEVMMLLKERNCKDVPMELLEILH